MCNGHPPPTHPEFGVDNRPLPPTDISIMCHRKEPIGAMQIVQKDISENLHIRDVGLYAVKLGREDSDAPPQGGFSHAQGQTQITKWTLPTFTSSWASKPI